MIVSLSEAEMTRAAIREIITGEKLLNEMQHLREHHAAREAQSLKSARTAGALGKPVLVIPQREWFRIRAEQGDDCWSDRGFVRDMQKKAPQLAPFKA